MSSKKKAVKRSKKKAPKMTPHSRDTKQLTIPGSNLPEEITSMDITEGKVKKITTKIIVGKKRDEVTEKTALYSVVGVAVDVKAGESNYGPWLAIKGQFEAHRTSDGKLFAASLIILPADASTQIHQTLVGTGKAVEFSLTVYASPTLKSPGFEYISDFGITPRSHDPLAALRPW